MKKYKLVLFDADGTLFDYEGAENYAIKTAFNDFGVTGDLDVLAQRYKKINLAIWGELERGLITKETLRIERFKRLFDGMEVSFDLKKFGDRYLNYFGNYGETIEGAEEVCRYISSKYKTAIITNGIKEIQESRLINSSINGYINKIIVSDEAGYNKPDARIFDYALKRLGLDGIDKSGILIIGDSVEADIRGGMSYGIDTCWYNPGNVEFPYPEKPTFVINRLSKLYELL